MYDPTQLRSFLTVAQTRNFTQAALRLGLQQSTVSQHIRRLEEAVRRKLFHRDTHAVRLTSDGEAMLGFARAIVEAHERAQRHFAGATLRGRLRFGASEDFAIGGLPMLLRDYVHEHPLVDLELTVGLSGLLYEDLEAGRLDIVVAKRRNGDERGQLVWRERLAWVGTPDVLIDPNEPLPLIHYPPPSITRERALETLARHGRTWRTACTSGSLSGLRAAALSGLGVMAHSRRLMPGGLQEIFARGLPDLGEIEFVLLTAERAPRGPAAALAAKILADADRLLGEAPR